MNEQRKESIKIKGGEIPIVLYSNEDEEGERKAFSTRLRLTALNGLHL